VKKTIHIIHCAFKALSGTVSIIPETVFLSKISCKAVIFSVYKSVFPRIHIFSYLNPPAISRSLVYGVCLTFKYANGLIWMPGKNNFDRPGDLPVSEACSSTCQATLSHVEESGNKNDGVNLKFIVKLIKQLK
jgi:hypothetical protein